MLDIEQIQYRCRQRHMRLAFEINGHCITQLFTGNKVTKKTW